MPLRLPSPEARSKSGPFPPGALCCTPISGTTTPSDSRCPPRAFTIGLYPWSLPDEGQADGPLLFRTELCARATTRTPEGPDELTPEQGSSDVAFAVI